MGVLSLIVVLSLHVPYAPPCHLVRLQRRGVGPSQHGRGHQRKLSSILPHLPSHGSPIEEGRSSEDFVGERSGSEQSGQRWCYTTGFGIKPGQQGIGWGSFFCRR